MSASHAPTEPHSGTNEHPDVPMSDQDFSISIPRVDWNGHGADMRSRLMTWEWRWKIPQRYRRLVMDFSKVKFMEPWALSMFAAYGLAQKRAGLAVTAKLDSANPANLYLRDMGVVELLETGASVEAPHAWAKSAQNTGLHIIRSSSDIERFRKSMAVLTLAHCDDAADALRYVMTELARNVVQHSASEIGGIAIAQHFPDAGRLQVAMCDLGRGVKASLQQRYPELKNDLEGLRLSILPHSSGAPTAGPYSTGENAGLGLFYSKEIAWRAGGSFWIGSQRALLGVRGDLETVWESKPVQPMRIYRDIQDWRGTFVVLDFPANGVPDFAEIIRLCASLADEARRMAGPAGLDFSGSADEIDLDRAHRVRVLDFEEDNEAAVHIRDAELRPRIERGERVVLDFRGVRAPTQSFVHALCSELFKIPGSLVRLTFLDCSPSAREIVKAVAAYATYARIV